MKNYKFVRNKKPLHPRPQRKGSAAEEDELGDFSVRKQLVSVRKQKVSGWK